MGEKKKYYVISDGERKGTILNATSPSAAIIQHVWNVELYGVSKKQLKVTMSDILKQKRKITDDVVGRNRWVFGELSAFKVTELD